MQGGRKADIIHKDVQIFMFENLYYMKNSNINIVLYNPQVNSYCLIPSFYEFDTLSF